METKTRPWPRVSAPRLKNDLRGRRSRSTNLEASTPAGLRLQPSTSPANGALGVRQRHGVPRTATAITWRGKGERARARRRLSLRWGARADVRYR